MTKTFTAAQVRAWRNDFLQWIADVEPRVPSARGGFEVFRPAPFQVEAIRAALERNSDGTWKYTTIGLSYPRRHSKTTLIALLCLWRFTCFTCENIVAIANSERQITATGFSLAKKIVLNTPLLLAMIGRENVQTYKMEYPRLQNSMRTMSCNVAGLYGERVTVAWCSEIHAATSDEAMQVLASSLGDSLNSWLLIDSTVDAIGGSLHRLEQLMETGEDPTVFVHRLQYRDLDQALAESPPWIRRDWLKSRAAQLLPAVFATQHLNQRGAASNNLFALADIERAQDRLPMPFTVDDLTAIAGGRTFACGGGLDRAYFGSLHGDATIWTSVAKVAGENGQEPDYYVLHQQAVLGSLGTLIKKAIIADSERYSLQNICIESYNAQDIATWAVERQLPAETIHATNTHQAPAFMELYRIVKEGRLYFSDTLKDLAREMETFLYELKGDKPRFGSDKWHDDRVYSLCWAIYSLRQQELAAYTLDSVVCASKSQHARLCYLRSGDMVLLCSQDCPSHRKVDAMFRQYMARNVESELQLPQFYQSMVKMPGITSYKAI
jgi:hypothetical protein